MKKRVETLAKNVGIYAGIGLILLFNIYFWTAYTSGRRTEVERLRQNIEALKGEIEILKDRKSRADQDTQVALKKIAAREEELKRYGDFLPNLATKPEVVRGILSAIEELGIRIEKITNSALEGGTGGGYVTFTFGLELVGTYRDFKLLLARIYKDERVIRIKKFFVSDWDTKDHLQKVTVEFETYFASS